MTKVPTPPSFLVTGTFTNKAVSAQSGVIVLVNNQLYSYTTATATPLQSSSPPDNFSAPTGLCGDINNGVAICCTTQVAYLTGVGIAGANWNLLPQLPSATGSNNNSPVITAMCGDLLNGLVITDGTNLWSLLFNGTTPEWTLLAAPPAGTILGISGDPTQGILLVLGPDGGGPSSLYYGSGGCSCSWVPLTATGYNLPVAKIQVAEVCGNVPNGFVIFGENQFYTYTLKYTAGTATTPATCVATPNKFPAPPFAVSDVAGDATNGCTALGGATGLIATTTALFPSWTVINATAPATS